MPHINIRDLGRLREISAVLVRHGFGALVRSAGLETEGEPGDSSLPVARRIRLVLEELGDLEGARSMLGRPISVFGRVVKGQQMGRKLGFPTANLDLAHELHPPPGVYACQATLILEEGEDEVRPAVANIGFRPTVSGEASGEPTIEVHLLDFEADLYGAAMELEFAARIRDEQRFDGLEALRAQIARDVDEARRLL